MALKICPKCGMDNAQNQNYCSYCKFNMGAYVKKFAEETSSMNEEERKAYIYDKTSKPQAPTPPPKPYSNTWEFIKDKNISQYQLIHHYGFSTGTLDAIRKGKTLNLGTVESICKMLQVKSI